MWPFSEYGMSPIDNNPAAIAGDVLARTYPSNDAFGGGIGINKDPWSWITHFVGLLVAIVGGIILLSRTPDIGPKQPLMALYALSLILMFSTSCAYHFFDLGSAGNKLLRRLDHCAIFLLIAGTWLPPAMHVLDGSWRTATLVTMLVMTVGGIIFKLLWLDAPRWLGTGVYIAMGWGALIPGWKVLPMLDVMALTWLFGGGVFYSVGAVIYATKRPDPWPGVFGFHEVWHLFVIAGAACHYALVSSFCDGPCLPL